MPTCSDEPEICEVGGSGLIMPLLGDAEQNWPQGLRICLYLVGLFWCFLGVAIIADVFMGAIERVTSKKMRKLDPKTKRYVTINVWNPTVANLTLMALGSSAPEILLSVIELFSGGMKSGALGPSTIVGSAAFNLLCITAVCIVSIPKGEVRRIEEMPVYMVTASCSLFAYLWLLVILQLITPNVVDIWEGLATFLFFPILVIVAFLADKGYFSTEDPNEEAKLMAHPDMTEAELAQITLKIRQQHGEGLTDEQVSRFIASEYAPKTTRAAYRIGATRAAMGGRKVALPNEVEPTMTVVPVGETCDDQAACNKKVRGEATIGFSSLRYAVLENVGVARLPVVRTGDSKLEVAVGFRSRDGTAAKDQDYEPIEGVLTFAAGETEKTLSVKIIDDDTHEDDEDFFVDLTSAQCLDGSGGQCHLNEAKCATVVIIDDDEPGVLKWEIEERIVSEALTDVTVNLVIQRVNGCTGKVGCSFATENGSAIEGADYEKVDSTVELEHGQMSATVPVVVKASGRFEKEEDFRVVLSKPFGGAKFDKDTDGGKDSCICTVIVKADKLAKDQVNKVMGKMRLNWDKAQLGHSNWKSQFTAAIYVNGGDEDEDEDPPGAASYVMHAITLPWKVIFACVPPVDYCDGWLCFFCALCMIGGVTAIIGDLAALVGCTMTIKPDVTAITFVALGTSLPDTFASKVAAVMDPSADASIGNVTGSNSVNVFLGLGMPWMIGAIYWVVKGPDAGWIADYPDQFAEYGGEGRFVVEAGSLNFSVTVFCICGAACMGLLWIRRQSCGGELGGPEPQKYASAAFLVFLWLLYIGLSAWKSSQSDC